MAERGKEMIYLAILDIIRVGYNCRFSVDEGRRAEF